MNFSGSKGIFIFLALIALVLILFGCTNSNENQSKPQILFVNPQSQANLAVLGAHNFEGVVQQAPCQNNFDLNKYSVVILNGAGAPDLTCLTSYVQNGGKLIIVQDAVGYYAKQKGIVDCMGPNEVTCDPSQKITVNGLLFNTDINFKIPAEDVQLGTVSVFSAQPGANRRIVASIKDNNSPYSYVGIIEESGNPYTRTGNGKILYFNYDPFTTPQVLAETLDYLAK